MYKVWLKSVQNLKYGIYQKHINIMYKKFSRKLKILIFSMGQ